MTDFTLPPVVGPGSQPLGTDDRLDYLPMPQDMRVYAPHTPEVDDPAKVAPAMALMAAIGRACTRVAGGGAPESFEIAGLDAANRALIADTLGEGEVSVRMRATPAAAQESVFAGVWLLSGAGGDRIEVATVPTMALAGAHEPVRAGQATAAAKIPGLANAPSILTELLDKSACYRPGDPAHVVNLSLLPHTEADLAWLDTALGEGAATLLSRGYGNCRVSATATPHLWRVQFFNSMDTLILDTFEVVSMPEVVIAAPIDLSDSAERLRDVLETIR